MWSLTHVTHISWEDNCTEMSCLWTCLDKATAIWNVNSCYGREKRTLDGPTCTTKTWLTSHWAELATWCHQTTGGPRSAVLLCAQKEESLWLLQLQTFKIQKNSHKDWDFCFLIRGFDNIVPQVLLGNSWLELNILLICYVASLPLSRSD